jgi:hypothetical protein
VPLSTVNCSCIDFAPTGAASALNSVETLGLRRLQRDDDRSPYREARTEAEALAEMQRCAGTQFDPQVVAALVRVSAAA